MIWVLAIFGTIVLFFIFPKQMIYLAGVIVLIVGGLFAYNSYTATLHANRLKNVFVLIDRTVKCPPDYPIPITINNASDKTITSLSFTLRAFHPGFSDSVYEGYYTSTKIQSPNEFYSACYAAMLLWHMAGLQALGPRKRHFYLMG